MIDGMKTILLLDVNNTLRVPSSTPGLKTNLSNKTGGVRTSTSHEESRPYPPTAILRRSFTFMSHSLSLYTKRILRRGEKIAVDSSQVIEITP